MGTQPRGEAEAARQPHPHCLCAALPLTVGLFVLSFISEFFYLTLCTL